MIGDPDRPISLAAACCSDTAFARLALLVGPLLHLGHRVAVTPRAQLTRDLAMDSLDRQSLACELDEAFTIAIPDDDIVRWCTLADVAATVDRLLAERFARALRAAQPNYAALGLGSAAEAEGRN